VVFIVVWGRIQYRLSHIDALALGTAIYVVNMALLGLSTERWHIYALTLISAFGAAALISIPITYLQELIADRARSGQFADLSERLPGGGISAPLFSRSERASATIREPRFLSSLAGVAGLLLLLFPGWRPPRKSVCVLKKTDAARPHLQPLLIPVPVTGIQPAQALGLERLFRAADAALLDPCDKHRDEGGGCGLPDTSIDGLGYSQQTCVNARSSPTSSFLCRSQESSQPKSLRLKRLFRTADAALLQSL
jgi:MFS family permease